MHTQQVSDYNKKIQYSGGYNEEERNNTDCG
ncbi:hypothetical protein IMSAGC005_00764 [Lachnospiraceae bacterium]|nr:hypothetical protein IMSAGC005_00764 [Lachnospiraceae bacterium]